MQSSHTYVSVVPFSKHDVREQSEEAFIFLSSQQSTLRTLSFFSWVNSPLYARFHFTIAKTRLLYVLASIMQNLPDLSALSIQASSRNTPLCGHHTCESSRNTPPCSHHTCESSRKTPRCSHHTWDCHLLTAVVMVTHWWIVHLARCDTRSCIKLHD